MFRKFLILILLFTSIYTQIQSQTVDSSSFSIVARQSFYSFEKNAEILLHIPPGMMKNTISVTLSTAGPGSVSWNGIPGKAILRMPFIIDLKPSDYIVEAKIKVTSRPNKLFIAKTHLIILPYKANEVKTDRFTGGLIVNKLDFFPFGFYCYSPVYPTFRKRKW